MASSSQTHDSPLRPATNCLSVRPYDVVASWLVALLFIVGFFVLMMFMIWLTYVLVFTTPQAEMILVENIAGRGDHAEGLERDIEAPGAEEMEEETEPKIEQLLEAVTDVVSTQAAALDSMSTDATSTNKGVGVGDSRPPGPLGEGEDGIPRAERWQIQYNSTSINAYAKQLDFFDIELAALGGGSSNVNYAKNLAGTPKVRETKGEDEKRLYMTWSKGTLKKFDQALLSKANINPSGRIHVQFYPDKVVNHLATIELAYGKARGHGHFTHFRRTVFGVRRKGTGYEYYVISQLYRQPKTSG